MNFFMFMNNQYIYMLVCQEFGDHENVVKLLNVIKADNDKDIYLVFEYMGKFDNSSFLLAILRELFSCMALHGWQYSKYNIILIKY